MSVDITEVPAALTELRRVTKQIIVDTEKDAARLEGRPFTGREVATVFGETLATVQALAKVTDFILTIMENQQ